MKINVGDFKIGGREKDIIMEVLNSGRISEGTKVRQFEIEWAKFVGTKYAVAVNSGTSALIAGLVALKHLHFKNGIQKKIITTPLTYVATSNAIVTSGFEPIYVDVDEETFGITPESIKSHLEQIDDISEYALVLPVHLMGYSCDMNEINKIAHKYGLETFEDSAQAHGTIYNGKRTGSLSLVSSFSFYVAHNIQVGEMGAITTDNLEIAKLIKSIKANGRVCNCPVCYRSEGNCPNITTNDNNDFDPRFTHNIIGYNFKTMEFQAALGLTQLEQIDYILKRRNYNVKYLNEGLEDLSDKLQLPIHSKDISYLAYPIVIKDERVTRKNLRMKLEQNGIETRPLFGCIPTQQPSYAHLNKQYKDKLPNADYIGKNAFYIGCHQYLEQDDLDYIIAKMKEVLK